MAETLLVNEIYLSLQGESTFAGLPCVFIRLARCNLRCSYCDTAYAFAGGDPMELEKILARVSSLAQPYSQVKTSGGIRLPLVELTGGEPLLQTNALPLMTLLCNEDWTVLLETSGALDISPVDARVRRIVDVKCPSSGEAARNFQDNLSQLRSADEVKFVIGTLEDYDYAKNVLGKHRLTELCPVLFSWAHPLTDGQKDPSLKSVPANHTWLSRRDLAERIIADALPVRFQVQLHKIIWPPEMQGV